MKKSGKRQEEQGSGWADSMRSLAEGGILAVGVTLGLLLFCSLLVSGGWLSQHGMERYVPVLCIFGGFAGACLSMRKRRDIALILGMGTGIILWLLLMGLGMLLYGRMPNAEGMAVVLCACLCGGGMAGILGRRKGKKKRRR